MKLGQKDAPPIISKLEKLSTEKGYTKIVAKIHPEIFPLFQTEGYHLEAFIPEFYKKSADCLFVSRFTDIKRNEIPVDELNTFYNLMASAAPKKKFKFNGSFKPSLLNENDVVEIAEVFKKVFKTYPFPVYNPEYLTGTMQENGTKYFGIHDHGKLIGVSTAEIDYENGNAEMTDFAVLPEYRGQKLALRLLLNMEVEMKTEKIQTVYTIARLREPGMNKTFLNSGYKYTGTLVNNTNISGSIESMNVLYKHL